MKPTLCPHCSWFADDQQVLPLLLPIVEQRLAEQDWRIRESAILALGAVSEGCHMGLAPYLTGMVKMLLPVLQVSLDFESDS